MVGGQPILLFSVTALTTSKGAFHISVEKVFCFNPFLFEFRSLKHTLFIVAFPPRKQGRFFSMILEVVHVIVQHRRMLPGKMIHDSRRLAMLADFQEVGCEHRVTLIPCLSPVSVCYQPGQ